MRPTIRHLCGCKNPATGAAYPYGTCPKLVRRGHGYFEWRAWVPRERQALVGKRELRGREPTKTAAEKEAEKAIASIRAGQRDAGALTVGVRLDEWLAGKRRLRPSGRANYERNIRIHLKPLIGDIPLADLSRQDVEAMLRRIEADNATRRRPVGPKTLAEIFGTLRTALNDAVDHRLIPYNPCNGVELPEYDPPEVEPWEPEELGRFLDEMADDRLAAMYELIALGGVRRGEACGASWDGLVVDPRTVDDEKGPAGTLTIRQQITDSGGPVRVSPPKTRSGRRKVDLGPTMLGSLMAHRLAQDSEREAVGPAWANGTLPDNEGRPVHLEGLMFTKADGSHLAPEYITAHMQVIARRVGLCCALVHDADQGATTLVVGNRHAEPVGTWTVYVDRQQVGKVTVTGVAKRRGAGAVLTLAEPLETAVPRGAELGENLLSRRRLHDMRHGSASISLAEGVDITLVSKRLGHSSPHVTAKLYAHLLRSTGQAVAEKVEAAVPRRNRSAQRPPSDLETGAPASLRTTDGGVNRQVSGV